MRHLPFILLVAAFLLLRLDFWWSDETRLVAGLPISLLYHALYCVAAGALAFLLGRYAFPATVAEEEEERP